VLRRVHKFGHVPELLITFGLSYVMLELVQLVWGRTSVTTAAARAAGPAFTIVQSSADGSRAGRDLPAGRSAIQVPPRGFMMVVALLMLVALWLLLTRTRIGLVIQAALTPPGDGRGAGPQRAARVHAGVRRGCALAGLAGVIGGITFVTEPAWRPGRADHLRGGGGRRHGLAGRRLRRVAADRPAADLRR
jgi:branched-chain amino acid transport system permease protein